MKNGCRVRVGKVEVAVPATAAEVVEVPPEEFSRVIDVNLKGVHLVNRAFLPAMMRRRKGVVVNFSSGWGRSTSYVGVILELVVFAYISFFFITETRQVMHVGLKSYVAHP